MSQHPVYFADMSASADVVGPGTIVTPRYQAEILDMVQRRGWLGRRMSKLPASGQPSRYWEQTRIVLGGFRNPRQLQHTPGNDPTRRERAFMLKALQGDIQFGLFDVETTRQQGTFSTLVAKDIIDTVDGVLRASDLALWNGADTSLTVPTDLEYVGGLTQINRTATISSTASIIDGLKAEVASMMAQVDFKVMPTAIYLNPVLADLIDQEERSNHRQIPTTTINTVTGGLIVDAIATQAGLLPLLSDWTLQNGAAGGSTSESGKTDYKAVILSEDLVEYHYVRSADPRVYALGLEGDLATRYTVVLFGAPVFKGKANSAQAQNVTETSQTTYSHSVVTVVR